MCLLYVCILLDPEDLGRVEVCCRTIRNAMELSELPGGIRREARPHTTTGACRVVVFQLQAI